MASRNTRPPRRRRCSLCNVAVFGLFDGLCLSCQVAEPLLTGEPEPQAAEARRAAGFVSSGVLAVPRQGAPVSVLAVARSC